MLHFKPVLRIFLTLLTLCVGLDFFYDVPGIAYAFIVTLFVLVMGYGSVAIDSQFFVPAICNLPTDKRVIALTFDDGPNAQITPQVLDILKEYNAPATFFCIGKHIAAQPDLLQRIATEGHLIGNHSYSHSYFFDFFTASQVRRELEQTNYEIAKIIGKAPRYFRPPYGITNPAIRRALQRNKSIVIGWNVRSLDTITKDSEQVLQRVKNQLQPGSILLFHDTNAALPAILRTLLDYLNEEKYEVARLNEVIGKNAYES